MDRQTDRRTAFHGNTALRVASRGKNEIGSCVSNTSESVVSETDDAELQHSA